MAKIIAALVVSVFVAGSALSDQSDHTKVMRKHTDALDIGAADAVQLNAGGEMKHMSKPSSKKSKPEDVAAHLATVKEYLKRANANKQKKILTEGKEADLCDCDFIHGPDKSNNCTDPSHEEIIEEQSLCESAAELSCPDKSCIGDPFKIDTKSSGDASIFNKHPRRCFIEPATDDAPAKWYFNPSGYTPTGIESGTPVCVLPEYKVGTPDKDDCGTDQYNNIVDETRCRNAATCLSVCIHDEFRLMNASEMALAPAGCHNSSVGCIRFNTRTTADDSATPVGKPICEHKSADSIAKKGLADKAGDGDGDGDGGGAGLF